MTTGSATSSTCSRRGGTSGVPVPYPVSTDRSSSVLLEYLGDDGGAAPRLAQAGLEPVATRARVDAAPRRARASWSKRGGCTRTSPPYNLLWWHDQVWLIDVPQAVDLHRSTYGYELLHRDVVNMCTWFAAKGVTAANDPDAVYSLVLS